MFKIYAKEIGCDINELLFNFNGRKIDNNDQREIFQVFNNIDLISVSSV